MGYASLPDDWAQRVAAVLTVHPFVATPGLDPRWSALRLRACDDVPAELGPWIPANGPAYRARAPR